MFIDTAGLRKSKIVKPLEIEMVSDTLKTVKYSNVCVLLMGRIKWFEQKITIAGLITELVGANYCHKYVGQVDNKGLAKDKIYYQLEISLSQIKKYQLCFYLDFMVKG